MRIHMGANYLGYELGREIEAWLKADGHEVIWHGADFHDEDDDYPLFSLRVGLGVIADEDQGLETWGVIVGGEATGEIIAANKVNGARAIPGIDADYVKHAREHANANILVIGAKRTNLEQAKELIKVQTTTKFANILDDARRIVNTNEYENSRTIEGWMIEH